WTDPAGRRVVEKRPCFPGERNLSGRSPGSREHRQANGNESHGGERECLASPQLGGFREGSQSEPGVHLRIVRVLHPPSSRLIGLNSLRPRFPGAALSATLA